MKKNDDINEENDGLKAEYDFSGMPDGVRGKYTDNYVGGTNVVVLDSDVAKAFPTNESVNDALRLLMEISERRVSD